MKIIDLSHTIKPEMPVYPGTESPVFEEPATIESDGFLEKKIIMYSHTGTHLDAPAHILENGKTLDQMPVNQFVGSGCVIDISAIGKRVIGKNCLIKHQKRIENHQFILFYSGWSDYWGKKQYFHDYPLLDEEAAAWLTTLELKGIGIDMISFDALTSSEFRIHKILLGSGLLHIENLTNLESVISDEFLFFCLPLKFTAADGSPVRAIAMLV